MRHVHVNTFDDFFSTVRDVAALEHWIYRGQARATWDLLPRFGRSAISGRSESGLLALWKRRAFEYVENPATLSNWDWLAIAQHHGLATRLLDWTHNPLAAAFFAVEPDCDEDAAVYAWKPKGDVIFADNAADPLNIEGIVRFNPRRVVTRIGRQSGQFSCHGPPHTDLCADPDSHGQIVKITINNSSRDSYRKELANLGVDRSTPFPDLDGLAGYLNWLSSI